MQIKSAVYELMCLIINQLETIHKICPGSEKVQKTS